jgi:hypothetical protein
VHGHEVKMKSFLFHGLLAALALVIPATAFAQT